MPMSPMGLWGWSNLLEGGGSVEVKPAEVVTLLASYRYAELAEAQDRWTAGALSPVGAAPRNRSKTLGHEIEATLSYAPWPVLDVVAGYGVFFEGNAASAILKAAGRETSAEQWAYLSTRLRVP